MRGVHCDYMKEKFILKGSSPHARGPQGFGQLYRATFRIIPACAGSTSLNAGLRDLKKDHPRMRGVHL